MVVKLKTNENRDFINTIQLTNLPRYIQQQLDIGSILSNSFKQINITRNLFYNTFPNQIFNSINVISKNTALIVNQYNNVFRNLSENLIQLSQSVAITNSFAQQILPQLNIFDNYNKNFSIYKNVSNSISEILIETRNIFNQIDFSSINSQLNHLKEVNQTLNFGQSVVDYITNIKAEEFDRDFIIEGESLLINQINKNTPSIVGSSFFQNLMFFILNLIIALYLGKKQENDIVTMISHSEGKILDKIEIITPDRSNLNRKLYIVRTKLNVRIDPSSTSTILDKLYPNNKVEFIKNDGNWFYIKYFDFLDGLPKNGWVYGKYLMEITNGN